MERPSLKERVKTGAICLLARCRVDRFFRFLNRNKLLVVMYHGITAQQSSLPVWTQLPVRVFRGQLEFLREHYRVVSLSDVVAAVEGKRALPERAALITFDDGIRNNFSVAFPHLVELGLPASIFLTVDLVGSRDMLWFDELYLLMQEGMRLGIQLDLMGEAANGCYRNRDLWQAYQLCVESVKHAGAATRDSFIERLRSQVPLDKGPWLEDFGLLDWEEVDEMRRSGLISFGVHTATHRILSELQEHELVAEVAQAREKMISRTGEDVTSFCYPNGRPGEDFDRRHQQFLRDCGYRCAFTTKDELFDWRSGEPMGIGRVPAGNDCSSEPDYFSLNTSGAVNFLKRLAG
uniref:Polysaccharide deacetylase n=1 Tax=Geobacter sp. (strain M21) TaxID=443144 RepID=C6DZW4_GEOSM